MTDYCRWDFNITRIKFNHELDVHLNTVSGLFDETFYPGPTYYVRMEPGTTEDFAHVWLGDSKCVLDLPNNCFEKL